MSEDEGAVRIQETLSENRARELRAVHRESQDKLEKERAVHKISDMIEREPVVQSLAGMWAPPRFRVRLREAAEAGVLLAVKWGIVLAMWLGSGYLVVSRGTAIVQGANAGQQVWNFFATNARADRLEKLLQDNPATRIGTSPPAVPVMAPEAEAKPKAGK